MKKIYIIAFLVFLVQSKLKAQCSQFPIDLSERVNAATLIIEAKVGQKNAYWNNAHSMIITSNQLLISKIYKGKDLITEKTLDLTTLGGTVGLQALKVNPELDLEPNVIGIFLLVMKEGQWVSESGEQGFIQIDKYTGKAYDVFNNYGANAIQPLLVKLTGLPVVNVNEHLTKIITLNKRAAPSISSFSPSTITAGTNSVLTIKGSNFGMTRDTSKILFADADKGGSSFVEALKRDYISWSDTMIRLVVRTKAGTGKIRAVVGGNGIVTTGTNLTVSFAHLNVVTGDSIARENQVIGSNVANGITWNFSVGMNANQPAKDAFVRSLERWRCGTFINWDTLGTVNFSEIKRDNVNICAWDTNNAMPNGVLAQCFSWYSGCFAAGLVWFTSELDIRFRVKPSNTTNWNYSINTATGSEYHFESVATHEIGHGHQLGHVIASSQVMHFSIANGAVKPSLSVNDIDCGNYVITKSGTSICSKPIHKKLNASNCSFVKPEVVFSASKNMPCVDEFVSFIDSSKGNISAYLWNFGAGANPQTAATKGPLKVVYAFGGTKTIKLSIITSAGNVTDSLSYVVSQDTTSLAKFSYVYAGSNIVGFTNLSKGSGNNYEWLFGDGDTSIDKNPSHKYVSANNKVVKLSANGACNSHDTTMTLRDFTAINMPQGDFIFLSPNPANSSLVINTKENQKLSFQIMNSIGVLVLKGESNSNTEINIIDLPSGVYFINIDSNLQKQTFKFIKVD